MRRHGIAILVVALAASCSPQSGDDVALEVRPGDAVDVTIDEIELSRELNISVLIGGRQSRYVKLIDAHRLRARVPLLPSGTARVEVRHEGQTYYGPTLNVTALGHQRISLFVEADSAVISAVEPTDDPLPSGPAPTSIARISYDFFSEDGSVSVLTTVLHPLGEHYEITGGGHESHDPDHGQGQDPDQDPGDQVPEEPNERGQHAHGDTPNVSYELEIVVPAVQGRSILRVFEAKAGLDLSDPHNAHSRKLLGEFILPIEE